MKANPLTDKVKITVAKPEREAGLAATHGSESFAKRLGEALQDVWNDHCADTGCAPTCFEMSNPRTKLTAHLDGSSFVSHVAELMHVRALKAPVPELEGCFPLVLYLASDTERQELVAAVKEAKPRMVTRDL